MAEQIVIEVIATDKATPVMKAVTGQTNIATDATNKLSVATDNQRGKITDLNSALSLGLQVYHAVSQAVSETYGAFQKYAGQVRDLSLITKTGAEETSRFIQVIDDYQLTAEDAETATKALKENGLVPTVETLAKLADQYKKIKDPAEAFKFIQDNLGRGGAKWVNVLNQEGDALRAQAEQVSKNLILSDEQIEKAEKERLAIDALSDAWQGLKVQAGAALGEMILSTQVGDAEQAYLDYAKAIGLSVEELEKLRMNVSDTQPEFAVFTDEFNRAREYGEAWAKVLGDDIAPALDEVNNKTIDLSKSNTEYLSLVDNITGRLVNYEQEHANIQQQLDEGKITLEEAGQKWQELADQQELASRRMILSMLQQQLAVDGLDTRETNYLLQIGQRWGVYSSDAVAAAQKAMAEVNTLTGLLNKLPSEKNISINVNTNYTASGQTAGHNQQNIGPLSGGYAEGGISTGPTSGHLEMLHGTEAVIPLKNGSVPVDMGGNSGGIYVTVNYSTMMSLGSETEIKQKLIPIIIQGAQEAKAQGKI